MTFATRYNSEVLPHGKTYQSAYGNLATVRDQVPRGFFHTVFLGLRVKTEQTEYCKTCYYNESQI